VTPKRFACKDAFQRWRQLLLALARPARTPWRGPCLWALAQTQHPHRLPWSLDDGRLLKEVLRASDPALVALAVRGLEDAPAAEAFPLLEALAGHRSPKVRKEVAAALDPGWGPIGTPPGAQEPARAIALLEVLRTDPDPGVCWEALLRLHRHGAFPADAVAPGHLHPREADLLAWHRLPVAHPLRQASHDSPLLQAMARASRTRLRTPSGGDLWAVAGPDLLRLGEWLLQGATASRLPTLNRWGQSRDQRRRQLAALLLGSGGGEGLTLLRHWLASRKPSLARLGRLGLAAADGAEADRCLRELLDSPSLARRQDGVKALYWRAMRAPAAFAALAWMARPVMTAPDPEGGMFSLWIDSADFGLGTPPIVRDPQEGPLSRFLLPDALFPEAPAGVPPCRQVQVRACLGMLRSSVPALREAAMGRLIFSGADRDCCAPALLAELDAPEPEVRRLAYFFLKATRQFERLEAALGDAPEALLGLTRITVLGLDEDPGWRRILQAMTAHPSDRVRFMGLEDLALQGDLAAVAAPAALPTLLAALRRRDTMAEAAHCLQRCPRPGTLAPLRAALDQVDAYARENLLKAILVCPDPGSLAFVLQHWDRTCFRTSLAEALAEQPSQAVVDHLRALLRRPDPAPGIGVCLGRQGTPEALAALRDLARDSDLEARSQAVEGLAQHPGAPALASLRVLATEDPHAGLRRKALRHLGLRPGPEALASLHQGLGSADAATRRAAVRGLLQRPAVDSLPLARLAITAGAAQPGKAHPLPFTSLDALAVLLFRMARQGPLPRPRPGP